ncbi:uracil-DNA glycosylase family protein [Massilia sp. LC238]|uniref:uracil-DNA glycosylase n=1 Tax=Massilia sp. LC238 TaxID=1502852 RepID=UPI0004E42970|nr:uracil-DNA glycosylase [Massilia sp. LC238]KFC70173.1 Uracil-DNA glycosylase, family 4 [Massilia sp. LC238]
MNRAVKHIGDRDAAFLAEMGIGPLWSLRAVPEAAVEAAPQAEPEPAPAVVAQAAPPAPAPAQPLAPPPMPRQVAEPAARPAWTPPPREDSAWGVEAEPERLDVSSMDWAALRQAVASCRHCSACSEGRKPVLGAGARQARWLVAAGTASAADEKAGQPLTGEPGKLLDNMLAAVGMSREADVYVTALVKCRPANAKGGDRAPTLEEVAACRPFLERERELTGAGLVLTLGQVAIDGLLGKPLSEPLAGSRGKVHRLGEVPLVATLHPGELLRRGGDKALAWADLCRARAAADGRAG